MKDQPQLKTDIRIEGSELVLEYEVENSTARDLYLLNRIPTSQPKWELSPDTIYIDFETKKKGILFSKEIAPMPPGVNVVSPIVPFVTPVRAGESITEIVKVPVPVKEYHEYNPGPKPESFREEEYGVVRLVLAYYLSEEGVTEETRRIEEEVVILPKFPTGVRPTFGRLDSGNVELTVPVLEPIYPTDPSKK